MNFIIDFLQTTRGFIIGAVCGLFTLLCIMFKCFRMGRKHEINVRTQEALKNIQKRHEVDNEISKKSDSTVRSDLNKWMRKQNGK